MPAPLLVIARLQFGWNKPRQPILGSEFAGIVEAVGPGVTNFEVGEAVFGYLGQSMKAGAEYLVVAANGDVAHKPEKVSFAEAAVIPYGAITAHSLLQNVSIQPGQKVLINGASGSIGSAALQLAKLAGAEVTAVCGANRMAFVRSLGADEVLDYKRDDFTQNGQQYDLIFDVLGRLSFADCRQSLTPHGRVLYASFKSKQLLQMLRTKISGQQKVICALSAENSGTLPYIAELMEAGKLQAGLDKTFPMAEVADAHRYVEYGQHQGKVALTIRPDDIVLEDRSGANTAVLT